MNFTQAIDRLGNDIRRNINTSGLPIAVSVLVVKEIMREMQSICAKEMNEGVDEDAKSVYEGELEQ